MSAQPDFAVQINRLKKERQAVILAHYYQRSEVQDIADYVGDSLGLAQQAARTDARIIIFCGVHFMAETAAILCPDRQVLMPDPHAGCPLANMVTVRELEKKKKQYPDAVVVTYVNSPADIKAISDYCCTSSNAVKVVQSIPPDRPVIFVPDKSLGRYVERETGRQLILWHGYCPTHHRILASDIKEKKKKYPNARVTVHPECTEDVIKLADKVVSTSGIIKYVRETDAREFIIGTEMGILHRLKKDNPDKLFLSASRLTDCPNMKLITLEKILWSLEDLIYEITVPPDIAARAQGAIKRMLQLV